MKNSSFPTLPTLSGHSLGLSKCMDTSMLRTSFGYSRKSSRLYSYADVLGSACRDYFRIRNGVVYVHDGRVWIPCSDSLWKKTVRDAFVGVADASTVDIAKNDFVISERKILDYAYSGISDSELGYNGCVVGFSNGVWDFSNIDAPVRHKFSERLPVTELLPYEYDPEASCPTWDSFLHTMLPSDDVLVLQKFFGLGVIDRKSIGRSIEESLWLIGDGANGKSTIQSVMRGVFGPWNVSNTRLDALLDRNIDARMRSVACIEGKLFNMCEEISGTDIERGSDMFKSLVSGSPQEARSISRNIWSAYDIPFFVFSMNQKPNNKKMDDAFRRRMVTIDFRSSVRVEDMDRSLGSRLAMEYSGIRNWAIDGYRKLAADGFTTRIRKKGLSDEDIDFMIDNDQTVDVWKSSSGISASSHVGHTSDEVGIWVKIGVLRKDYEDYCIGKLLCEPVSSNQFGRDLRRLHFESKRMSNGIHYRVYVDSKHKFNNQI